MLAPQTRITNSSSKHDIQELLAEVDDKRQQFQRHLSANGSTHAFTALSRSIKTGALALLGKNEIYTVEGPYSFCWLNSCSHTPYAIVSVDG